MSVFSMAKLAESRPYLCAVLRSENSVRNLSSRLVADICVLATQRPDVCAHPRCLADRVASYPYLSSATGPPAEEL